MVDSGVAVSLLPSCHGDPSELIEAVCWYSVVSVCGGRLNIRGELSVCLSSKENTFRQDFLVCDDVPMPILGVDFLSKNAAVIDFQSQVLRFPNESIQFESSAQTAVLLTEASFNEILSRYKNLFRDSDDCVGHTSEVEHAVSYTHLTLPTILLV